MSGISAPRRLRTKTSDLADFFRSTGPSSSSSQQKAPKTIDNSVSTPSMMLEVPSQTDDPSSKKKITRIPLFGRSRKKSTHSASERPDVTASTSIVRDSADVAYQSSRPTSSSDRQPSEPSIPASPTVTTKAQDGTSKTHAPSLTSKFAAHFSHARSSKILRMSETEPAPVVVVASSPPSSGLAPPSPRSSSFESGSSRNSKARSTTPRPSKPTITVSPSPDLSEFKDLFVKETPVDAPVSNAQASSGVTQSSPPSSPRSRLPSEQPVYPRRGQTPASAIAAAVRHGQSPSLAEERPPSTSSRNSRRTTDSDKSQDNTDTASTPRNSDHTDSPRPAVPEKDRMLPPSLQRRTSLATSSPSERIASPLIRSRTKTSIPAARTKPPTAPLPLPPPPNFRPPVPPDSPSIPSPKLPSRPTTSPKTVPKPIQILNPIPSPQSPAFPSKDLGRRRAHTIGAVTGTPQSPLSRTAVTRSDLDVISASPTSPVRFSADTLNIDLATARELREALQVRNKEFDELSAYVLKMTQAHLQEVATLEKKIFLLEKEVIRRDKEITGLKYVINDDDTPAHTKPPTSLINRSRFSTTSSLTADSDQDATNRRSAPPGSYRRPNYQSDSGNESHANSGAESLRASQSGASGSESTNLNSKRIRRPYGLGESAYNLIRSGTRRSCKVPPAAAKSDGEGTQSPGKRASVSTMSVSPSSSTSSLLPPSPSITMSSLSAIPEGTGSVGLKPSRYETSDPEDRRASRAAHRISTSSMASSSTAASSVYSANIKRSRPTSIAQVLEKTPNMDDVLEKLRPFA
ncbi:hypothetical protein BJ165DRAFT_689506 [Panaeolus papilionaceus]|nr:hypothetical protein BJ165DRAFT_689506 [Panaeolus papilionaceus]